MSLPLTQRQQELSAVNGSPLSSSSASCIARCVEQLTSFFFGTESLALSIAIEDALLVSAIVSNFDPSADTRQPARPRSGLTLSPCPVPVTLLPRKETLTA